MPLVDEGVGGHDLHRRDAERAQMLDHAGMGEAGEAAARRGGNVVAQPGQAAQVRFVDDGALPGDALAAGLARLKGERDRLGSERSAVAPEGEHRFVQAEGPIEGDRVRVGEQLGDVEAGAAQGVERAVGAQAVARAGADAFDRGAVDAAGVGAKAHARRLALAGRVVEAEIDGARMRRIDRDVGAARRQDDAERRGLAAGGGHESAPASAR